jgi:molecular chaperone GrpE (heat shock protein)
LDFNNELNKLLEKEQSALPTDGFAELVLDGRRELGAINKKQSDMSLQVEEIYDIVERIDTGSLKENVESERRRADGLLTAVIGLCDTLEDFFVYASNTGDGELTRQANMMRNNSAHIIERAGLVRVGEVNRPFDPETHTVRAAMASHFPREHVAELLQSGYRYLGDIVRKAAIVISNGSEE